MIRKASKELIDFIASYEGFSPTPYKCVPTEKYLTIGYGHYGKDVTENMEITKDEALDLLSKDIESFEKLVNDMNKKGIYHFTQNEFDGLVSFTYNCGGKNLNTLCNYGKRSISEILAHIKQYNKSGGKVLNGLVKRRNDEYNIMKNKIYKRSK